jgi:Sulfotransferase family
MMESLLQRDGIGAHERVELHFALGTIYRKLGEHEQSFQHLLEGNKLKRRQFDYDVNSDIEHFARLREMFSPAFMAARAGHGNPSAQPIFIVGMPRSGSTLLEQILAGHPRVHAVGEKLNLHDAIGALKGEYPDNLATISGEDFGRLGIDYLARATASMPANKDRFTDKVPGNVAYAGLIHLALPNARIIHTRRDPVDNCFSCFSQYFLSGHEFSYDLGELGRFYCAIEEMAAYWRDVLPAGVMLNVQYEDVVADIETQARRVLDFCGLEWDEACLAFHDVERPVRTASAAQVRQPIYRSSVGRWRVYEDQLQPLLEALGQRG